MATPTDHKMIGVWYPATEHAEIKREAHAQNMSIAEYVRSIFDPRRKRLNGATSSRPATPVQAASRAAKGGRK